MFRDVPALLLKLRGVGLRLRTACRNTSAGVSLNLCAAQQRAGLAREAQEEAENAVRLLSTTAWVSGSNGSEAEDARAASELLVIAYYNCSVASETCGEYSKATRYVREALRVGKVCPINIHHTRFATVFHHTRIYTP